ncbi:hypothetical protein ARMGADRAFT_1166035 [Armillaria gallica]|uniref:Fungal-type protein kinase domain-containing protein n=1 Tax=Armillaria gallica TaxID=47427 RepID=A0A2H3DRV6_ARMGA|nr:hypothetical protein ARMGADRAFT_1166035 [Armillaria gallica]
MFVTGIALRDTDITLWYHDPMGGFHAASFNFEFKPKYLILILYAMCVCTPECAGFNPFLDPPTFPDEEEPNWKGRRFVFEDEFRRRRTFVTPVEPVNETGKALPPLVLKLQWPSRNSPATGSQLIWELLNSAPELKKHLPEILQF